ncbi:MAG: YdcF family protein [Pseudomonadota bacterium]
MFSNYLMGRLEDPYTPRAMSVIPKVDVIVLLGGAIRGDTHMSTLGDLNQQADRVVHALALFKAGKAPRILISGGGMEEVRSEAEIMQDLLTLMGVPAAAIVLEDQSRNTYDNAVMSAAILREMGAKDVLLVTSAFHMRRAEAAFKAQGVEVITAPTDYQRLVGPSLMPGFLPSVGNLQQTTYAIHETLGYWIYRFRGRL